MIFCAYAGMLLIAAGSGDSLNLLQLQSHREGLSTHTDTQIVDTLVPRPSNWYEWPLAPKPKFGPDGTWATPFCKDIQGCDIAYCVPGCNGAVGFFPHPYKNTREAEWGPRKIHFLSCYLKENWGIRAFGVLPISAATPGKAGYYDCTNSENASKPFYWGSNEEADLHPELQTREQARSKMMYGGRSHGHEFCPDECVDDCAEFKFGQYMGCGYASGSTWVGYDMKATRAQSAPNKYCEVGVVRGGGYITYTWCGNRTTTTTTTTTEDSGHVCRHYESEDTCPDARCSWDGDACTDPPCSSHTAEIDCCGDCAWEAGQCQPAMFKACPKEGKPGSNVCPEGCTFVDNCEQCEFAAGVWEKDYSTEPWKESTGSRPQGCFRNRKFNIKCNKFEPGSKYPSGVDKVGTKRGKWPICKVIEPPKKC